MSEGLKLISNQIEISHVEIISIKDSINEIDENDKEDYFGNTIMHQEPSPSKPDADKLENAVKREWLESEAKKNAEKLVELPPKLVELPKNTRLEELLVNKLTYQGMVKDDFDLFDGKPASVDAWVVSVDLAINTHSLRHGGNLKQYQKTSVPLIGKRLTGEAKEWFSDLMKYQGNIGYTEFITQFPISITIN